MKYIAPALVIVLIGFVYFFNSNQEEGLKDITLVKDSLYYEIIQDYQSAHEDRIIQDFGQPNSKVDAVGLIDQSFWSEDHSIYSYSLDNGAISFYVNKENGNSDYLQIFLQKNSDVEIKVPSLSDKGGSHKDIVFGKSTYGDIFELGTSPNELKDVISYQGGSAGNSYTELHFYYGKYGEYHEFIFGVPGLFNEEIENNPQTVSSVVPNMLLIK